jgi:hypothetical protein
VAGTGGALALGALPRIWRYPRVRDALLLAAGVSILSVSRPYEGLILTVVIAALLAFGLLKRRPYPFRRLLTRVLLPAAAVLALTACGVAYYNWRTTGSPLRTPYQVAAEQYVIRRMFVWQSNRPEPVYHHAEMRALYRELLRVNMPRWHEVRLVGQGFLTTYFGWVLALPLVMIPWVLRDRRFRPVLLSIGCVVVGLACIPYVHPHYAAPITAGVFALIIECLRHVRVWRPRGFRLGRLVAFALVLTAFAVPAAKPALREWRSHHGPGRWSAGRAQIEEELRWSGARHLIVVRYSPAHNPHREWVYNRADIDGSPVIWAREMRDNRPLLEYFRTRRIWLLEADRRPYRLTPYPQ